MKEEAGKGAADGQCVAVEGLAASAALEELSGHSEGANLDIVVEGEALRCGAITEGLACVGAGRTQDGQSNVVEDVRVGERALEGLLGTAWCVDEVDGGDSEG